MPPATLAAYDKVLQACKAIFETKHKDYATAWRILRLPSVTDQIMIKAQRIRSIEAQAMQKVPEGAIAEFVGIVNYSIIALMQIALGEEGRLTLEEKEVQNLYNTVAKETRSLLEQKNHDYNEAWRQMRLSSLVDIILMKLLRIKAIEDKSGETLASEGVKAGYQDILNYAAFALIRSSFAT